MAAIPFTFRQVPTINAMLEERGISLLELLRDAKLPVVGFEREITAPLSRFQEFIDTCAQRLKAPLFGIDLADRLPRGAFGVTEFVTRAAPTVRGALEAVCELAPLVNPLIEMRYVADTRGCEIRYTFAALRDGLGTHLNEYTVRYVAQGFAAVLGHALPLQRAWFAHARKKDADAVAQRLGCEVTFQAADCGFAVESNVIDRKPTHADAALFEFLITQARTQLETLGSNHVIAQTTRAIEAAFAQGDITPARIAAVMATTPRSLQRHLAEAGTSFRDVLAKVRRRRRDELVRYGLAESDIATRLGFANARSMRRSLDEPRGDDKDD